MLPNHYVGRLLEASLREVGGYSYTPEEESFARQIVATLVEPGTIGSQEQVRDWIPTILGWIDRRSGCQLGCSDSPDPGSDVGPWNAGA